MLKFKPKLRVQLERNNAADRHYAAMFGKEPAAQAVIPATRTYSRNEQRISEADVNDTIRAYMAGRDDLVLWRNNRGMARGHNGAPITYGVGPNGASDWIGYRTVVITPCMVGTEIAQFVAVEAKAPDAGKPDDAQMRFVERVNKAGGRAIVARSRSDVEKL